MSKAVRMAAGVAFCWIFVTLFFARAFVAQAQCAPPYPNAALQAPAHNDVYGADAAIAWTNPLLNNTDPASFVYQRIIIEKDHNNPYGKKYLELGWMKRNRFISPDKFAVTAAWLQSLGDIDGDGEVEFEPTEVNTYNYPAAAYRYTLERKNEAGSKYWFL